MTVVRSFTDESFVRLGGVVAPGPGNVLSNIRLDTGASSQGLVSPSGDLLNRALRGSVYRFQPVVSRYAFGQVLGDFSQNDYPILASKPANWDYNPSADSARYNNLLGNIIALRSDRSHLERRFSRDHEVFHRNFVGEVIPSKDYVDDFVRTPGVFFSDLYAFTGWAYNGSTTPGTNTTHFTTMNFLSGAMSPGTTTPSGAEIPNIGMRTRAWVEDILVYPVMSFTDIINGTQYHREATILATSFGDRKFSVKYKLHRYDFTVGSSVRWGKATFICVYTVELNDLGSFMSQTIPANNVPVRNYEVVSSYTYTRQSAEYQFDTTSGTFGAGPTVVTNHSYRKALILSDCSSAQFADPEPIALHVNRVANEFTGLVRESMHDLTPAAFRSSADALESHVSLLQTNYLEVAADYQQLLNVIPDVRALIRALTVLGSNPLSGIIRLGDVVSDIILQYSFGTRPSASAVAELNRMGPRIMDLFNKFTQPKTIQVAGSFFYDFLPHEFHGLDAVSLEARSTLYISYSDPTFAQVFQLESLGLLPGASRIWEAIPFSFVVDWFTGMSSRLRDVDLSLLFMLMTVHWAEHSYAVRYRPSEFPLQELSLASADVEFVTFIRHLSAVVPPLRESRFDFRRAAGPAYFASTAALAFQFLSR
jgi:hypothetical protein